jgi:hypothetical protein
VSIEQGGQPWADVSLRHVPAGRRIPGSAHSVSVSIPDIASVIGFESGDEATLRRIPWGYPRFRVHPYVTRAAQLVARERGEPAEDIVLTCSARAAAAAAAYAGLTPDAAFEALGMQGVRLPAAASARARVCEYIRHTGSHLSSRKAEDVLLGAGLIEDRQPEATVDSASANVVKKLLAGVYGAGNEADVSLHNSGMNALAAAIAALSEIQRANGRRRWIQLGWIFFDTVSLLQKRVIDVEHTVLPDPFDLAEIARLANARGPGRPVDRVQRPLRPVPGTSAGRHGRARQRTALSGSPQPSSQTGRSPKAAGPGVPFPAR